MHRRWLLCALIALGPGCAPQPVAQHVPATGWDRLPPDFWEQAIGDELRALREPVISRNAGLAGLTSRYRLLLLNPYPPSYSKRIDVFEDGHAELTWISGSSALTRGEQSRSRRRLTAAELASLEAAIEAAALPSQPRQERYPEGKICVDSTIFVFQYLDEDTEAFVVRNPCELDAGPQPLRELMERTLNLERRPPSV